MHISGSFPPGSTQTILPGIKSAACCHTFCVATHNAIEGAGLKNADIACHELIQFRIRGSSALFQGVAILSFFHH
jgi:hypothetical protein